MPEPMNFRVGPLRCGPEYREPSYGCIAVGVRTAGSVIASRLTERADTRVLLIEAGSATAVPVMELPDCSPVHFGAVGRDPHLRGTDEPPFVGPTPSPVSSSTNATMFAVVERPAQLIAG
jgi:choline dehydrogenase-like flavoprotein